MHVLKGISDELTEQFYKWEKRGRGWNLYSFPIQLEPTFIPFFFHFTTPKQSVDDGRRPSLRSRVKDGLQFLFNKKQQSELTSDDEREEELYPYVCDEELVALVLSFPKELQVGNEEMARVLFLLASITDQVSFEIVANHEKIFFQFVCRRSSAQIIKQEIVAHFPFVSINEEDANNCFPENELLAYSIQYGLQHEFMRPLAGTKHVKLDNHVPLFSVLDSLHKNEQAMIQILFSSVANSWSESIMRSVTDFGNDSFFQDAPEMSALAKEKVNSPLCAVTVRVIGMSSRIEEATSICSRIGNAVCITTRSSFNSLIPLMHPEVYDVNDYFEDVLLRRSRRSGMLLNLQELISLVHFPSAAIQSNKLLRQIQKSKSLPSIAVGHSFHLGENCHLNVTTSVTISSEQRFKHTHIIGATGTGKSTLLTNLILQDINEGNGVAVLDPHGDLIDHIIECIPEKRIPDVIVFNPADELFPLAFNILSAKTESEKTILSSDLVGIFKRLSTSWGDQMNSVFANAILAMLESSEQRTLIDLRRFLIEKEFRQTVLSTVADEQVKYYWVKEFPLLKSSSIGPILTRLDSFLRPKLIRNMVAQPKGLNVNSILNKQQILLVKLSQGLIGQENSFLLGSFVVAKLHQAALARQSLEKSERKNFFLYIDEFQHFITPSMTELLSGSRKYHLGLILAHQDMQQVVKADAEVAASLLANAGSRICFRLGDTDAKRFSEGFSHFESSDIQNLQTGESIVRIERPDFDCNMSVTKTDVPCIQYKSSIIIEQSRKLYATPKEEVESAYEKTLIPFPPDFGTKAMTSSETIDVVSKSKELIEAVPYIASSAEMEREHIYLQKLIKKMAEQRGFVATLEAVTKDGKGKVDVSLVKGNERIACEICISSSEAWEVHNIKKCLKDDYTKVIVCSESKVTLAKIKAKALIELNKEDFTLLEFFQPQEFFTFLDHLYPSNAISEERIKGYRINVQYQPLSKNEEEEKKNTIIKTVTRVIKRKKEK